MPKPMVETADFTKRTYDITEENGTTATYTFQQLCAHFGIKYISVYKRVKEQGMTVDEAIRVCMRNPRTWGCTYNNGYNVMGAPAQYDKKGNVIHD